MSKESAPAILRRIPIPNSAMDTLVGLSRQVGLGGWHYGRWAYPLLADLSPADHLTGFLIQLKEILASEGFLVISFREVLGRFSEEDLGGAVSLLTTTFGKPLRIFQNLPSVWREVDVDLERPPNRSRGVGLLALHMDFVNAEFPPDLICLFCVRPDPRGGGYSLVSRLVGIEDELSEQSIEALSAAIYSDGAVHRLAEVGRDINPFAVYSPGAAFKYRYTSNLLSSSGPNEVAREALSAASGLLASRMVSFLLEKGDLLVLNQHHAVHGRMPVGGDQEKFTREQRRLVLHSFLRAPI